MFAELANCLDALHDDLRSLIHEKRNYVPGSPAAVDCEGEPFAAEWGKVPAQSAIGHALLCTNSCLDHLAAAAVLIRSHRVSTSLYTVMRGASEAAAIASYVLDPAIDARERLRRSMNCRLDGLCEQIAMVEPFADKPAAAAIKARLQAGVAEIERSARTFGFTFHKAKKYSPAYLGDRPPGITTLIDNSACDAPGVGAGLYRVMSGVAHAGVHGLIRLTMPSVPEGAVGADGSDRRVMQLNLSAETLARDLFVGPLCASTVVEYLLPYLGWDLERLKPAVVGMLETWGRVRGTAYPGPEYR